MGHQFLYNEFTEQDCKSEGTFSSVKNDSNSGRYTMNKKNGCLFVIVAILYFPIGVILALAKNYK